MRSWLLDSNESVNMNNRYNLLSFLHLVIHVLIHDLKYRIKPVILFGFSNFLPDLLVFGILRPFLWRLAGVDIPLFGHCVIRKDVWVDHPEKLKIGNNVQINRGTTISAHGGVTIMDDVTLSFYVGIHSLSHKGLKHEIDVLKPVSIGSGSIIYSHAVILPGTIVGSNCVVGAGALAKGDIKSGSKVINFLPKIDI
ncbi:acyltransferase [Leptospira kanakyensis]|uniref:acyltransferase n=1 Tax=Leptospira kanakyensis TaxID=2484968 RepID=UPI00223DA05F|nr:acyltransferase [Leptospira kanakyensis]MCW7482126.1 acyltransferase [Leptospira kanakyensis]